MWLWLKNTLRLNPWGLLFDVGSSAGEWLQMPKGGNGFVSDHLAHWDCRFFSEGSITKLTIWGQIWKFLDRKNRNNHYLPESLQTSISSSVMVSNFFLIVPMDPVRSSKKYMSTGFSFFFASKGMEVSLFGLSLSSILWGRIDSVEESWEMMRPLSSLSSYQVLQLEERGRQPRARLGGLSWSRHHPQPGPPDTRQDQQSGNFSPFSSRQLVEWVVWRDREKTSRRRTRTAQSIVTVRDQN